MRNYLLKATKNTSLNKIKTEEETVSLDAFTESDLNDVPDLTDQTFFEIICNKARCDTIVEAIESLSDTYRNAMYYHYVMEMTIPQTAKLLDQTISATKSQLVRGKKMLFRILYKKGDDKHGDQ